MKKQTQYFKAGTFVHAVTDYDSVVSGHFIGFTDRGNAILEIDVTHDNFPKLIAVNPKNVFDNLRLAIVFSRFKEEGIEVHFFPASMNYKKQTERVREMKVVDYLQRGKFVRELDLICENVRLDGLAVFVTHFEADNSILNQSTKSMSMAHITNTMNHELNNSDNREVQSAYFTSRALKSDFILILN